MDGLYKVNEALGTWTRVGVIPAPEHLEKTRSFVAWILIENGQRREVARGKAR